METAIWQVIGETVIYLASLIFALQFFISILVLIIGGSQPQRFYIFGGRGVFSKKKSYGQDDHIDRV